MTDQAVLTERRDGVLLITINRPDARNAVNLPVAEGIAAALDDLDADDGLAVGVLTGAGKGFCAGMDLKAFVTGERPWVGDRGFAGIVQRAARKPLIAAVEASPSRAAWRSRSPATCSSPRAERSSASPRSSARSSPRAARCCACRSASRTAWRWSSR